MVVRPDRARFWKSWRRRLPRLVVIVAGAAMATLLLLAIDWAPLRAFHLDWLLTTAVVLLSVLWIGIALLLAALAVVAMGLRVERLELDSGRIRRTMVFGRRLDVALEGASLTRRKGLDVVRAASTKRRVIAPHLFYAPEDLDRLWAVAGLTPADPASPPTPAAG